MMKRLLSVLMLAGLALPARAHALDEYLQATMLSLSPQQAYIQIRLTPGSKVAADVIAEIDSNGEGVISQAEQEAYADRVRRGLSLSLDGNPLTLLPVSSNYPSIEDMRQGTGDIVLGFEADLLEWGDGQGIRKLTFENHNDSKTAVYMVNCAQPKDPSLGLLATDRFKDQSVYRTDFIQGKAGPSVPGSLALDGLAFAAALLMFGLKHKMSRQE